MDAKYPSLFNLSLPFIFQVVVVSTFLFYKGLQVPLKYFWKSGAKRVKHFFGFLEYELLVHSFFLFELDMVIFCCLNLLDDDTSHWLFFLSYYYSVVNLLIMTLSIPLFLYICNRPKEALNFGPFKEKWGVLYHELILDNSNKRFFFAFSNIRYLFLGIFIVFGYNLPLIQVGSVFGICTFYMALMLYYRPYKYSLIQSTEFFKEVMFTVAAFLFLVLAMDDHYVIMRVSSRLRAGWMIIVIFAFSLVVSLALSIANSIRAVMKVYHKYKDAWAKRKEHKKEE